MWELQTRCKEGNAMKKKPDFTNCFLFLFTKLDWIENPKDQCFWLANDDPLSRLLFSLNRQKTSFFPSSLIFYYALTLSYRCISAVYSIIQIIQIPILTYFAVLWNPNWILSSLLPSVQKHSLNSFLINSLIFLNIFDCLCIVVFFTN